MADLPCFKELAEHLSVPAVHITVEWQTGERPYFKQHKESFVVLKSEVNA